MTLGNGIYEKKFDFTIEQFQEISTLIYHKCRIQLPIVKMNLVRGRLNRRMIDLNIVSVDKYIFKLNKDFDREIPFLVSSIATNVTSFFREQRQLDSFLKKIAPDLICKSKKNERVRIWSAGCSTGEEPYTIAAILLGLDAQCLSLNIKILATDVDRNAISYARRGVFDPEVISAIPPAFRACLFSGESRTVSLSARRMILFNELNLFSEWVFRGQFDVIFCRNVCIYFDADSCDEVWRKLSHRISPGGFILVGSSEKIPKFESLGLRYFGEGVYGKMKGELP